MFTLTACGNWFSGSVEERIKVASMNRFKAIELLNWKGFVLAKAKSALEMNRMCISKILFQTIYETAQN
jgi:hypothetical protein